MAGFVFWQRWLVTVAAISAAAGLMFVVAPSASLLAGYNLQVLRAFHGDAIPASAMRQQAWSLQLLGTTILGWGLLLTAVTAVPFRRREPWAWYGVAFSVVAWVVPDSILAYRAGIYLEVLWNGVALALFAIPLRMTYREMILRARSAPRRSPSADDEQSSEPIRQADSSCPGTRRQDT